MKQDSPARKKHNFQFNLRKIIFWILLLSMVGSTIFVVVRLIQTWGQEDQTHSDYKLMVLQCLLGIAVIFLPTLMERKWKLEIPNFMAILYFIFLYCAIYLGEVRAFYTHVPHWDTILHTFSGFMLAVVGFVAVDLLNRRDRQETLHLSPLFVGLFAFCFAVALGAVWEIWEYFWDCTLGLNMQKYLYPGGEPKVGQAALNDTMKDIIVDTIGAVIVSVWGGIALKVKLKKQEKAKSEANRLPAPEASAAELQPEEAAGKAETADKNEIILDSVEKKD